MQYLRGSGGGQGLEVVEGYDVQIVVILRMPASQALQAV